MDKGKVILVGAGPGDPGLITLSGLESIKNCDLVVYDRLVSQEVLNLVPAGVERIYVGKHRGSSSNDQDRINDIMLEGVKAGKVVIRLKGGDPFIFGRGSEERNFLEKNNVSVEIIPGVSSALAVPASVGIPLTDRNHSSSIALVTGEVSERNTVNWGKIVKGIDTIVVLMGVGNLSSISAEIISAGRDLDTPVAIIQNGTLPNQRMLRSTLGKVARDVKSHGIAAPSILVVGEVVRLARQQKY